ncbi:hypothetical protein PRIPAC_75363 [Pristionchus pacificus]|nr:hypothetical protein PRIPAC_75363 [Pristionchus pacificus]
MSNELISSYMHWQDLARILKPGDLVEFKRLRSSGTGGAIYKHWAVYIGRRAGNGEWLVIHYSNEETKGVERRRGVEISGNVEVKWETLESVADGCPCRKNNGRDQVDEHFRPDEIVERAKSKLGEGGYNFVTNNCEHFANYCRYGKKRSGQVNDTAVAFGAVTAAVVGGAVLLGAYLAGWFEEEETEEQRRERERGEARNRGNSSNRMLPQ